MSITSGKSEKSKSPSPQTAPHILVVGGTGMLSGVVEALAGEGARVSVLARKATTYRRAGVTGYDANYFDDGAFETAVIRAVANDGPVDLAVAWFRTLSVKGPRQLAEHVGTSRRPGRFFQVLGHATMDPAHPKRLAEAAAVAEDLPACQLRQVVLGFRVLPEQPSRWLTDEEIAGGVLEAIRTDRDLSVVGQVTPWAARP